MSGGLRNWSGSSDRTRYDTSSLLTPLVKVRQGNSLELSLLCSLPAFINAIVHLESTREVEFKQRASRMSALHRKNLVSQALELRGIMQVRVSRMIAGCADCWAKARHYVQREESPDTTSWVEQASLKAGHYTSEEYPSA